MEKGSTPPKQPIIQSLWLGESLSPMERTAIKSFLSKGHSFHLYVYEDFANVPKGTELKDASTILPSNRIFKYNSFDSYAGFANLFRYALLLQKGNYWVDTDVICLRPFEHRECYISTERIRGSRDRIKASNAIMTATPGSEIIQYCFEQADSRNPQELLWGETGPSLITRAIHHFRAFEYLAAPEIFCPINWWDWNLSYQAEAPLHLLKKSWAIHLWNEMGRREGIDKHDTFPATSLYERLKREDQLGILETASA